MNYWTNRIEALATRIRRGGWRVSFKPMALTHGYCDYTKRLIVIDESDSAIQAFMTLCHEAGHRKAFLQSRCKTWKRFHARNPSGDYRELQAIVHGWDYVLQYTNRISQRRWLKEHRKILLATSV